MRNKAHFLSRTVLFYALIVVGFLIASSACNLPVRQQDAFKEADAAFWRSRFTEAERQYQKALEAAQAPAQRAQAYLRLCRLYRYHNKTTQALEKCQAALQEDAQNADVLAQAARTYDWMGSYAEAQRYGRQALQINPNHADALSFTAEAMADQIEEDGKSDFNEALTLINRAIQADAQNAEAFRNRGFIYEYQEHLPEASQDYQQAILLKPEFFAFYNDLGNVRSALKDYDTALKMFDTSLQLSPDNVVGLKGRGWTWWTKGEYEKAASDFRQATQLYPTDSYAWSGLGWSHYQRGEQEQARQAFENAIHIDPQNDSARRGLDNFQYGLLPKAYLDRAISAAVQLLIFDAQDEIIGFCSGSIIHPDGYILTNSHCVGDVEKQTAYRTDQTLGVGVMRDPKEAPVKEYLAEAVRVDYKMDVAILRIGWNYEGRSLTQTPVLPYLAMGDSDTVKVGDEVWALGFPGMGGESLTVTKGVVSGFSEGPWIKSDIMTGPGNSGCMVINKDGKIVGLHTEGWASEKGNARISAERPVNAIQFIWQDYVPQ